MFNKPERENITHNTNIFFLPEFYYILKSNMLHPQMSTHSVH